jgi:tRNA-guanine family transglycosylase
MQLKSHLSSHASFEVTATAGDARTGKLQIGDTTVETPMVFPVINFYGGGRASSLFGGSTHRTVKELMVGHEYVDNVDCGEYFNGAMMSVGSLTDYGISKSKLEDYLSEKIKEREEFDGFDGLLFCDSGGFKNLKQGGLDGSNFEMELTQEKVFDMQTRMGGDINVSLDYPIEPDDSYEERREKARKTAENAIEFVRLSGSYPGARYLPVHGYNYSMIDTFLDELENVFGNLSINEIFDGIALGSLVPKKDNKEILIEAVSGCKQAMEERGFGDLPLHVLGISKASIPLLVGLGVDSFDSSSYIQAAINGKYSTTLTETVRVEEADFSQCDCPVCNSEELRDRMRGNAEYRKDQMGPAAVHNQVVQAREIERIRNAIQSDGTDAMIDYIESTVGRNPRMRSYAHRIVNESLGGYF